MNRHDSVILDILDRQAFVVYSSVSVDAII
jgi:hypothetical protein